MMMEVPGTVIFKHTYGSEHDSTKRLDSKRYHGLGKSSDCRPRDLIGWMVRLLIPLCTVFVL